jgi:hypothetical protein
MLDTLNTTAVIVTLLTTGLVDAVLIDGTNKICAAIAGRVAAFVGTAMFIQVAFGADKFFRVAKGRRRILLTMRL